MSSNWQLLQKLLDYRIPIIISIISLLKRAKYNECQVYNIYGYYIDANDLLLRFQKCTITLINQ
jgi:hypothetical protein